MPLHVALVSHHRLPVQGYGGTERVVVALARGLDALGHRVTLLAAPGTRVAEAAVVEAPPARILDPTVDLATLLPSDADVVHAFFAVRRTPSRPFVRTLEGNLRAGVAASPDTIFVSRNHAHRYGSEVFVYNGLDPGDYLFRSEKDQYDLFLGRLHSVKGYRWAIEGAKRSGRRLLIAGGWRPSLRRRIRYVGTVDGRKKVGTRRGALPEVISAEVGALCDSLDEMVAAAETIHTRSPEACRAHAERYFTHLVMAEAYVRMYRSLLETGRLPPGRPTPFAPPSSAAPR